MTNDDLHCKDTRNQALQLGSRTGDMKSSGIVLAAAVSHSLNSEVGGPWGISFLHKVVHRSNVIGPAKGFIRLLNNFYSKKRNSYYLLQKRIKKIK